MIEPVTPGIIGGLLGSFKGKALGQTIASVAPNLGSSALLSIANLVFKRLTNRQHHHLQRLAAQALCDAVSETASNNLVWRDAQQSQLEQVLRMAKEEFVVIGTASSEKVVNGLLIGNSDNIIEAIAEYLDPYFCASGPGWPDIKDRISRLFFVKFQIRYVNDDAGRHALDREVAWATRQAIQDGLVVVRESNQEVLNKLEQIEKSQATADSYRLFFDHFEKVVTQTIERSAIETQRTVTTGDNEIKELLKEINKKITINYAPSLRDDSFEDLRDDLIRQKDQEIEKLKMRLDSLGPIASSAVESASLEDQAAVALARKDFKTAMHLLTRAKVAPSSRTASILQREGDVNIYAGNYADAVVCFDQALGLLPGNIDLHLARSYAYFLLGDMDHATADWTIVADRNPLLEAASIQAKHVSAAIDLSTTLLNLAAVERQRQNFDLAEELAIRSNRILSNLRDSSLSTNEKLFVCEDLAKSHISLGTTYAARLERPKALQEFNLALDALDLISKTTNGVLVGPLTSMTLRASAHLNRGFVRRQLGDIHGALSEYSKAVEIESATEEAAKALDSSHVNQQESLALALKNRSNVLRLVGDNVKALNDAERACRIYDGLLARSAGRHDQWLVSKAQALQNRANANFYVGNHVEAFKDFEKAISSLSDLVARLTKSNTSVVDPSYTLAIIYFDRAVAHLNRGELTPAKGDGHESAALLKGLVKLFPAKYRVDYDDSDLIARDPKAFMRQRGFYS
jgi:tetratricopeptide (TPR) repeat protein